MNLQKKQILNLQFRVIFLSLWGGEKFCHWQNFFPFLFDTFAKNRFLANSKNG
jgi:hypothetical protein